jgi:hypothetical protein
MTGERRVCGLRLDLLQDVDAGHVGQVEVEQDQKLAARADLAGAILSEQVGQRVVPFTKGMISLFTPARRMFFSISRAWPSSSSIITIETGLASLMSLMALRFRALRSGGSKTRNVVPCQFGATVMSPPRLRTSVRTCARPMPSPLRVLRTRSAEQLEDPLVVLSAMPRPLSATSIVDPA